MKIFFMNENETLNPQGLNTMNVESPQGFIHTKSGHEMAYFLSESILQDNIWDQCPKCGAFDAYLQKDVSKKVFIFLLIPSLMLVFYLFLHRWIWGMAFLLLLTAVDAFLFRVKRDRLVCYQCGSYAKDFEPQKDYRFFDHHIAEQYRRNAISKN